MPSRRREPVGGVDDGSSRRSVPELGGLDIAHLNAGVTTGVADITELTDEQYRRIVGVNRTGWSSASESRRSRAPQTRGGGAIVATASLAGIVAFPLDAAYTLTKHAVVGLVRSLGRVLAGDRITINACARVLSTRRLLTGPIRDALVESGFPLIDAGFGGGRCSSNACSGRGPARRSSSRRAWNRRLQVRASTRAERGRVLSAATAGVDRRSGCSTGYLRSPGDPETGTAGQLVSRPAGWSGPVDRRAWCQGLPAPARSWYQIGVIMMSVPVSSAWIISPGPTYMVTCPTYPGLS